MRDVLPARRARDARTCISHPCRSGNAVLEAAPAPTWTPPASRAGS